MLDYQKITRIHRDIDMDFICLAKNLYNGTISASAMVAKHPYEQENVFKHNLNYALYQNYLFNVINNITTKIWENQITISSDDSKVQEYLNRLQKSIDFKKIGSEITNYNLLYNKSYIYIQQKPRIFNNLYLEEKTEQDIPDLKIIDNSEVINFRKDKSGCFQQIVIRQLLDDEDSDCFDEATTFIRITKFSIEEDKVKQEIWETKRFDATKQSAFQPPKYEVSTTADEVYKYFMPLQNQVEYTLKSEIPEVIYLDIPWIPIFEIQFEIPLNLGKSIIPFAKTIFQLQTTYYGTLHKALNNLPVYSVAPAMQSDSLLDNIAMETSNSNPMIEQKQNGFLKTSINSKFEFVSIPTEAIDSAKLEIDSLVDRLYFQAYQSVSFAKKNSMGIVGIGAREIDDQQRRIIVSYISSSIKEDIIDIIEKILLLCGLPMDSQINIQGLDYNSEKVDHQVLISTAKDIGILPLLLKSKTFVSLFGSKIVSSTLDDMILPEIMIKITNEITGENTNENMGENK
jgi:hypothetical protein